MADKIAVISDIHGNIPALDAVLKDIKGRNIENIFCLGDIAGKGPSSSEAVDLVRKNCQVVIKGNWDFFITEEDTEAINWYKSRLGSNRLNYIRSLPMYAEFYMSGRLVRLCHASPNNLLFRVYMTSPDNERIKLFAPTKTLNKEADVVGYGDIHGSYTDTVNGKILFNTGSVGNPLDLTQASYAIIEGSIGEKEQTPFTISLVRVPYNIERAVSQAMETDMPEKQEYIDELRTAVYRGRRKLENKKVQA